MSYKSGEQGVPSITRDLNLWDSPVLDSQYNAHRSEVGTKKQN